ncbi:MAG: Nif3-like dinuclear metal center hexameric protein [Firmicutes bacterium]|nr:Nif3-like dinuclear metal center hexameric protein [Bacillota bacterium]
MSYKVSQCTQIMEQLAPKNYAFDWDNVGLQLGSYDQAVSKILVTLTITDQIAKQAIAEDVDLIVAHHPLIFQPLKHLRSDLPLTRLCGELLRHNIAVYVSHTNLDQAPQGLNYWLAEDLELRDQQVLVPFNQDPDVGLGRIGYRNPMSLKELAKYLQKLWNIEVRFVGDPKKTCEKIAVCGGSGSNLIHNAWFKNADVLVTGDVKYHDALDAAQLGIGLIDAGHFGTEQIMIRRISSYLSEHLPNCQVLKSSIANDPFDND